MVKSTTVRNPYGRGAPPWIVALGLIALGIYVIDWGGARAVTWAQLAPIATRPTPPDAPDGRVRGFATFHPEAPTPVPPCLWTYQRSKTRTVQFSGDNRVRFADGRALRLAERETVEFFEDEGPAEAATLAPDIEAAALAYFRRDQAGAQIKRRGCVGPTERVWVEGCVAGDRLVGCPELEGRVLLTTGDPQRRAPWFASHVPGALALATFGAVLLALAIAALFALPRDVVKKLAARKGLETAQGSVAVMLIFGLGLLLTLLKLVFHATYVPWIAMPLIAVAHALLVWGWRGRIAALRAALGVVEATGTARLHGERGGGLELALRVADDAPTVPGFDGRPHACVRFKLTEWYVPDPNRPQTTTQRDGPQGHHPPRVPVVDGSGRGMLDLSHGELDAPLSPGVLEWTPDRDASVPWLVGYVAAARAPRHRHYKVEWSYVDPGEPLLVYGSVQREAPSSVAPVTDYRSDGAVPVVTGSAEAPLVAHVGDEARLRGLIRRELVARYAGLALVGLALAAAVAAHAALR